MEVNIISIEEFQEIHYNKTNSFSRLGPCHLRLRNSKKISIFSRAGPCDLWPKSMLMKVQQRLEVKRNIFNYPPNPLLRSPTSNPACFLVPRHCEGTAISSESIGLPSLGRVRWTTKDPSTRYSTNHRLIRSRFRGTFPKQILRVKRDTSSSPKM